MPHNMSMQSNMPMPELPSYTTPAPWDAPRTQENITFFHPSVPPLASLQTPQVPHCVQHARQLHRNHPPTLHQELHPSERPPIHVLKKDLNEHDVLSGRGGKTNTQPGNKKFRSLVQNYKLRYLEAKKKDKPKIAQQIVDFIRKKGGRYLQFREDIDQYIDIGNEKAREKTAQALREGSMKHKSSIPGATNTQHTSDSSSGGSSGPFESTESPNE